MFFGCKIGMLHVNLVFFGAFRLLSVGWIGMQRSISVGILVVTFVNMVPVKKLLTDDKKKTCT